MQENNGLRERGEWVGSPADLAYELRSRAFEHQKDAAAYVGISRSMVSRYEAGKDTPQLGYMCLLAKCIADQESCDCAAGGGNDNEADLADYKASLIKMLNRIRSLYPGRYPGSGRIIDWGQLCRLADEYASQSRRRQARKDSDQTAPTGKQIAKALLTQDQLQSSRHKGLVFTVDAGLLNDEGATLIVKIYAKLLSTDGQ
jgi:transcriptional regulator with XRE-family HTH domain